MSICRPNPLGEAQSLRLDLMTNPPQLRYLVHAIVPETGMTILSGYDSYPKGAAERRLELAGLGPLRLAGLKLAIAVATGGDWFGRSVACGMVLWITEWQLGESESFLHRALMEAGLPPEIRARISIISVNEWESVRTHPCLSADNLDRPNLEIASLDEALKPYRLVLIDDQTRSYGNQDVDFHPELSRLG